MLKTSYPRFVWYSVLFVFAFNCSGAIFNAWVHDGWMMAVQCKICMLLLVVMHILHSFEVHRKR